MNLQTLNANSAVLTSWGIENLTSITEVLDGAVNRVFRIHTPEINYFLRVYKTSDPSIVNREHNLIHHVCSRQIPAVAPLKSHLDSTFIDYEGKLCALYPEALGHQLKKKNLSLAHAQAAGRMLAKIHSATCDLKNEGYRIYSLNWNNEDWIPRLNKVETVISQKKDLNESDTWALKRLVAQRRWLQNPQAQHRYSPQFQSQVLHGDYHEGNLFFGDGQVTGVIDWDQAVYMPRAFEVVRAASYMFDFESEEASAFIKAYLKENPMSMAELEDGANAWGCHSDHYVWAIEEVYLNGNERARVFIPHAEFQPFELLWQKLSGRL